MTKWLSRLSYKYGRYYISNLILYIIIGQTAVFAFNFLFPTEQGGIVQFLTFDRARIFSGEVWRVVSFILVPPNNNPILMVFFMILYYNIGRSLEQTWGGFYFNVYYFLGVILAIAGGFIAGYADITFLNMSLFIAFAAIFPNYTLLLFFILPVKIKYLAIIDLIGLAILFIISDLSIKLSIALSLVNIVIFFWNDFYPKIRDKWKYRKVRSNWKKYNRIESTGFNGNLS
ncbi:MAG: hypothetical protein LBM41_00050 [Ruminococcus sp.]|nr:hypothetical protein [Ruminococcus sp.]